MRKAVRYGLACAALVAVTAAVLAPWLNESQIRGLVGAGAVALAIQLGAFALLNGARKQTNRFLAVWVGGTLVRFAVVGVAAWVVVRRGELDPVTTLVGLAGYFFGMLLLEPVFLGWSSDTESTRTV